MTLPKDLGELGLASPEIEAKFDIPNRAGLAALKELVGSTITLIDSGNQPVEFVCTMDKESLYLDTCFDTKSFRLFQGGRMVRARQRYDLGGGSGPEYRFKKAVVQAKTAQATLTSFHPAVMARDEIRSTEKFTSPEAFAARLPELLAPGSRDKAVFAVRKGLAETKKLKPVLEIRDDRFFMRLSKKGKHDPSVPSFFVSLDAVRYQGLLGKCGHAEGLYLEAEIIDEMTTLSSRQLRSMLALLNSLAAYLERRGLTPSNISKYEAGLRLTVL
ncbi:MAG: hypothetical protein IPN59_17240 [Holophaga sp.]|nr:hypothetical protein [Holophaga sp.]